MTFQDYNLINYQLLRDIQKQNDDLCRTVQILKNGGNDVVKSPNDVVDFNDEIVSKQKVFFCVIIFYTFGFFSWNQCDAFFHIFKENEEVDDEASNASDVSFDSKMTDTTWIGKNYIMP